MEAFYELPTVDVGSLDSHIVPVVASSIQDVKDVNSKRRISTWVIRGIKAVSPISLKCLEPIHSAYFLQRLLPLHHSATALKLSCPVHYLSPSPFRHIQFMHGTSCIS